MSSKPPAKRQMATTGIEGLDDILSGGLTRNRVYLVQGDPGVGKTTVGLSFVLEGARLGERVLYMTLSETRAELEAVADSHGWSLDGVDVWEYSADEMLQIGEETTLFHPSEVELGETTKKLLDEVERVKPQRVVIDSLSEIRLIAQNPLRYRRQILGLKQYFGTRDCTVLLLDDRTAISGDMQLTTLSHGVIILEQLAPLYGAERRRLRVSKFRGVKYRGGYHDFTIRTGGIVVYPRLVAAEHRGNFARQQIASGVDAIDSLLGGGIDRGTSTLIMGPPGSGKSALCTQFAIAAAKRGENAAMFVFDESRGTMFARSEGLHLELQKYVDAGKITVTQIDPAEIPPGEFVHYLREEADKRHASVIVIDSLNGYLNAMPEEQFLTIQMHEVLTYLGQQGVATLLVVAQHGIATSNMLTPVDVSYLADSVVLLRFFELGGEIRKAISVMKKRSGAHEKTIRMLTIGSNGLEVGPPLREFRGVLSGTPMLEPNLANILGEPSDSETRRAE